MEEYSDPHVSITMWRPREHGTGQPPATGSAACAQHLLVHDQKRSEAVEVVRGPRPADVEVVVADVGADTDLREVRPAVRAERDPLEPALVTAARHGPGARVAITLLP